LTEINTKENINITPSSNYQTSFEAPISVLQTALTPISSQNITAFINDTNQYHGYYDVIFYFAELQDLSTNQSRQFNICRDGQVEKSFVKPAYLQSSYNSYYSSYPDAELSLVQLSNSTLPPILNAMEAFWEMSMEIKQLTRADDGKNSVLLILGKKHFFCNFGLYN
jgi:Malectin-like domain